MANASIEHFKEAIKEHLDNLAKRDGNFAQVYRKKHKNLDECARYIIGEIYKTESKVGVLSDEDTFGMAVHYYEEDSIKDIPEISCKVANTRKKVQLTDEEREKIAEEAKRQYKEEVMKELREERPVKKSVESVEEVKVPTMFDF